MEILIIESFVGNTKIKRCFLFLGEPILLQVLPSINPQESNQTSNNTVNEKEEHYENVL